MAVKKTTGSNNPLLHRVRQHATMATLFRTVEPPADYQSRGDQPAADRLVRATLVPQVAPESTEQAAVVSALLPERPIEASRPGQESPVSSLPPPLSPAATSSSSPETPPPAAQPARTGAARPTAKPEPPPEKESSQEDDENWNRLQAIYQAHQRKNAAEEQQEPSAVQEPPETVEEALPDTEAAGHVQRETAEKTPQKEAADATPDAAAPPAGKDAPPPAEASPDERSETTPAPPVAGGKEAPAERKKEDNGPARSDRPSAAGDDLVQAQAHQDVGEVRPERGEREQSEGTQHEATTAATKAKSAEAEGQPEMKSRPEPSADRSAAAPPAERSLEEQPQEPAPLEAVWPVQRKEETAEPVMTTLPISMEEAAAREAEVRARLEDVSSGQPSNSSVQLVPPRRPRPPIPPQEIRQEDKPSPKGERAEIRAEQAPAPQHRHESAPAAEETTVSEEAETISTEIGPLPADLWQLLGQEPPSQAADPEGAAPPPPPSEAPAPDNTVRRAIARSEAPAASPDTPAPAEDVTETPMTDLDRQGPSAPPAIQRQMEPTVATEADSGNASSPDAVVGEETETAEIDVDELARRVYSDIKRRLAVEWERARGRL